MAPIVILASAGGGAYYYFHSRQDAAEAKAKTDLPPPAASAEPAIRHPLSGVSTAPDAQPLPALRDSDPAMRGALEQMFGDISVRQMLVPEAIVRRIVVTIDNLPRQKIAVEKRPLKAVGGRTLTSASGDVMTLSDENYARYAPYVRLLRGMDT